MEALISMFNRDDLIEFTREIVYRVVIVAKIHIGILATKITPLRFMMNDINHFCFNVTLLYNWPSWKI